MARKGTFTADSDPVVKALLDSATATRVVKVNNEEYTTDQVYRTPLPPRRAMPDGVEVSSLQSLVDYLAILAEKDVRKSGAELDLVIHILHPFKVCVVGPLDYDDNANRCDRPIYCQATANDTKYPLERFISLEDFRTKFRAMFAPGRDWDTLLKIFGNVKEEDSHTSEDDGVTEQVFVKSGPVLGQNVPIPAPAVLVPYSGFPEVMPVERLYTVRYKKEQGVGLFAADGDRWQIDAIAGVREWLKAHTKVPVIG